MSERIFLDADDRAHDEKSEAMRPRLRYVKERAIERKRHLRGRKRPRKRKPVYR